MRHEPVILIKKGIVIYEPGSNCQGTAAQHCDNTMWLLLSFFIRPSDSCIAPFPNLIHSSWAREDALLGFSPFFHLQQTVTPTFLREEQHVFPGIFNRLKEHCDGTVRVPSNDNLHQGVAMSNFCTCQCVLLPRYSAAGWNGPPVPSNCTTYLF